MFLSNYRLGYLLQYRTLIFFYISACFYLLFFVFVTRLDRLLTFVSFSCLLCVIPFVKLLPEDVLRLKR